MEKKQRKFQQQGFEKKIAQIWNHIHWFEKVHRIQFRFERINTEIAIQMAHCHMVIPKKNKWYTKYSVDAVKKYMYTRVRGETSTAMIQFIPHTSFQWIVKHRACFGTSSNTWCDMPRNVVVAVFTFFSSRQFVLSFYE